MTTPDWGRQYDLIELERTKRYAKSVVEREMYEEIIHRIKKESSQIAALRQKLILATRAKDKATVFRVKELIQAVKLNATYGKSWGNNKGNRLTNSV